MCVCVCVCVCVCLCTYVCVCVCTYVPCHSISQMLPKMIVLLHGVSDSRHTVIHMHADDVHSHNHMHVKMQHAHTHTHAHAHAHTNSVGELGQEWDHSMVCYHAEVLLVLGNLGQRCTHTGQHLCLGGLEQAHNQLKAPHKGADQLPRVLKKELDPSALGEAKHVHLTNHSHHRLQVSGLVGPHMHLPSHTTHHTAHLHTYVRTLRVDWVGLCVTIIEHTLWSCPTTYIHTYIHT